MPLTPFEIERLRRNHDGGDMPVKEVLELLDARIGGGAVHDFRILKDLLVRGKYRAMRIHDSRTGGPDPNPRATMFVGGRGYHLHVDRRGVVFKITNPQKQILGGHPGYVAPGAAPPKPK